jgi:hypothetical protein
MHVTSPDPSAETDPQPAYRRVLDATTKAIKGKPLQDITIDNPYYRPVKAGANQAEALQNAIASCAMNGWRLTATYGNVATMTSGQPTNHILHLLITVFTLGVWLPFWLLIAISSDGVRQLVITADVEGNISYGNGR